MKVHIEGCAALKALFSALFPPPDALLVLGASYSTAEKIFHMEFGNRAAGKKEPCLLKVVDVVRDCRIRREDLYLRLQLCPGSKYII